MVHLQGIGRYNTTTTTKHPPTTLSTTVPVSRGNLNKIANSEDIELTNGHRHEKGSDEVPIGIAKPKNGIIKEHKDGKATLRLTHYENG